MNHAHVRAWFLQWAQQCIEQADYISDLDNAIGDGDHGYNMAKALKHYSDTIDQQDIQTIADEFKVLGRILLSKVGGTAGPIYASAFLAMSKYLKDTPTLTNDLLVEALQQATEAIMHRGRAVRYEKTLLDVWFPVIEDLKAQSLSEARIDQHVAATKPMKATKGRASYLGERSIGHIDPGSYSSGLLFKTMLQQS